MPATGRRNDKKLGCDCERSMATVVPNQDVLKSGNLQHKQDFVDSQIHTTVKAPHPFPDFNGCGCKRRTYTSRVPVQLLGAKTAAEICCNQWLQNL